MKPDLNRLLKKAFFSQQVQNATEAIAHARVRYLELTHTGGFSFELVLPRDPDEGWLRDRLVRPLVYYCESEGSAIPICSGVFVSLFIDDWLYCSSAAEVIAWACDELGVSSERLRDQYGTQEVERPLR